VGSLIPGRTSPSRSFTLILAGGGARGFAHLGVLRALEHGGFSPAAVVGVSMGAVVGVTYAMRNDWYEAVLGMELPRFPGRSAPASEPSRGIVGSIRRSAAALRTVAAMILDWGPGAPAREAGLAELRKLVGSAHLERARVPVVVTATDLRSGRRVDLRTGDAVEAMYASGALAGVLPPLERGDLLLADGAYVDLAPVDLAREHAPAVVIAVDAGQSADAAGIRNGFQAIMRAMDICHRKHAQLRFSQADLVLRPLFRRDIDMMDFGARRECVAAGIRTVRAEIETIRRVLAP
jgi:NTE family protein